MKTLQEILDPRTLSQAYVELPGTQPTPFSDFFWTGAMEDIPTDSYQLFVDPAEKTPAPLNASGAPARVLQLAGAQERIATLFCSFNSLPMMGDALTAIRDPNSYTVQTKGQMEVRRQLEKFRVRHRLQKEVVLAKILGTGIVYLNGDGEVLEDSTGAVVSADFGIDSGHQSQLDYDGNGDLISASWATAGTDIQAQLNAIDVAADVQRVPKPMHMWCNNSVKDYLRANTDFQTWAAASPRTAEALLAGSMVEGLFGKTWHFIDATYTGQDGTTKKLIADDLVIMTPEGTNPVFKKARGLTLVPSQVGLVGDAMAALAALQEYYGEYAYASVEHNPARLELFAGDKYGFNLADPNAIWQATVAF